MKRWALSWVLAVLLWAIPSMARGEYQSKGRRDPFIPLLTAEGQRIFPPGYDEEIPTGVAGLRLHGIVYDTQAESYAVINDEIVREGDEVAGMEVVKIGSDSVVILAEGQEHLLGLPQAVGEQEDGSLGEGLTEEP